MHKIWSTYAAQLLAMHLELKHCQPSMYSCISPAIVIVTSCKNNNNFFRGNIHEKLNGVLKLTESSAGTMLTKTIKLVKWDELHST